MQMTQKLYNMKTVTLLTGINEHTLRAWETRYRAVHPERTDNGRRIYSQEQIDRIRTLMTLTERGHAISGIATLSPNELSRLVADTSLTQLQGELPAGKKSSSASHQTLLHLTTLTRNFNLPQIQMTLTQKLHQQGAVDFILETISPLMAEIGVLTVNESISIAQEHAVSSIVRAVLFELLFSMNQAAEPLAPQKKKIIFATMEGDYHELGILSAAVLAKIQGHQSVYIGPNTPPEALALAADALDVTEIAIGAVDIHPSLLRHSIDSYIAITQAISKKQYRMVIGAASKTTADKIRDTPGVTVVSSLEQYQDYLAEKDD